MIKATVTFYSILFSLSLFAQEGDHGEAKDNFSYGNWLAAIEEYRVLIGSDRDNEQYNYRLGICYLQTFNNKRAAYHLKKAIKAGTKEKDALFMLGKAYHLNLKLDSAIAVYKRAITSSSDDEMIKRANRYIEMCNNAKEQLKYPLKGVKIENMGPDINSPEPDFNPFIDEEESLLFFNTNRSKGNQGYKKWNGLYTTDVFMSKDKRGEWSKPRNVGGAIGSSDDNEIVGLAPDGSVMFTDLTNYEIFGEILMAERQGRSYKRPNPIQIPVNSVDIEYSGCITPDGQTIYFASNRPGGNGGFDIYFSKLLPTGEWAEPQNLGKPINTEWDEKFPHITGDGKTFYFASEGHTSMGGFDIFRSEWDSEKNTWGIPKNIGYPVNSAGDDMHISLTENERIGYISGNRENAIGDLDIYQVTFENIEDRQSLITGKLKYAAPIDYKNHQTFEVYKKGELQRRFIKEFLPPDDSWTFVETEKKTVKEGFQYRFRVIMKNEDGTTKSFAYDKVPKSDPKWTFEDVKLQLIPIPNYKPPKKSRPTETLVTIKNATIFVNDKVTGNLIGKYVPSPKTGKFVIILTPGNYSIEIEADGFKPHSENLKIVGKSSFRSLIQKKPVLTPLTPPQPIHYLDIKD